MNINNVKLVYYSPTSTTRKVLLSIAAGLGIDMPDQIDLTLPHAEIAVPGKLNDDLVVFGLPVYEGRAAGIALERMQPITADGTPAVVVVVYGNRDFEDALLELNDAVRKLGFQPIAAGAFVGEHSFANAERPLANGRPDAEDLKAASEFGAQIASKLAGLESLGDTALITPPGNRPYIDRDRSALADRAATTRVDVCSLCGECALVCPVGAITVAEAVETDNMACTLCNACVKSCTTGARVVDDPMINKIANWVSRNYQDRRSPQTFI